MLLEHLSAFTIDKGVNSISKLTGQKVESFGEEIKAVTWHSLDIHQEEDGTWQATVLFDV